MQTDSLIQSIRDSLQVLKVDSLARIDSIVRADSLARIDSVRMCDSVKLAAHRNSGFPGLPHPLTIHNETWVVVALLLLFILIVVAVSRSGSLIPETIRNFFQVKERSSIFSKATVNDAQINFLIRTFAIGVVSLYSFSLLHGDASSFTLLKFLYASSATYLFFWIKNLLFDLMGYVFLDLASTKIAKESYFNVLSLIGVCLFPILLIETYAPIEVDYYLDIVALIICVIGYLLVVFRLFQIFLHKILASFYILLYLCTLEFLPFAGMYFVYNLIK